MSGMSGRSHSLSDIARSGIAPEFLNVQHSHAAVNHRVSPANSSKMDLYVDDTGTNAVDILNYPSWSYCCDITASVDGPDGNWVDKKGNLYVANYAGPYITEYSKTHALIETYSAGVADSVNVSTDKHGNVYEADYNYTVTNGGYVNEYAQGSNSVIATCSPGGNVEGVAIDKQGDVFVDYENLTSFVGYITEYAHGLTGCNGTVLGVTLGYAGGMVLDKNGNIVVCDQTNSAVDIIDPPYNSVTATLGSGYTDPLHVTINKKGNEAYVADAGTGYVYVMPYPAGTPITTLNSSNGITFAYGAVDGKNYVP